MVVQMALMVYFFQMARGLGGGPVRFRGRFRGSHIRRRRSRSRKGPDRGSGAGAGGRARRRRVFPGERFLWFL